MLLILIVCYYGCVGMFGDGFFDGGVFVKLFISFFVF